MDREIASHSKVKHKLQQMNVLFMYFAVHR